MPDVLSFINFLKIRSGHFNLDVYINGHSDGHYAKIF